MASGAKCFILNRKSDWTFKSLIRNIGFKNDVLVSRTKNGENGVYISHMFDSMQNETTWHRLRLDIQFPPDSLYKIRIYASDTTGIMIPVPGIRGKSLVDFNEYIADETIDVNRKIDTFDEINAEIYENTDDIILRNLKGRYLWICIELINYEQESIKINSMKVEFPMVSFVDYLPEIYRAEGDRNSFTERFVSIFQSIYVDFEDKIDYTPLMFNVDRTNKDFLNWIGDWLSVKNASVWGEEKLRKIIKQAVKIYKIKGTKKAVAKIVQEYTGTEPIIVEQFDVKGNMYYDKQKEVVENLFGDNGYVFTVMIPESCVKDTENYIELLRVINSVKPVDSICNLVALSDQMYLDSHCYMGINSFITRNEELVLNKKQYEVNNLIISNFKSHNQF